VVIGVFLGGIGIYPRLVEFAGAGASVPIVGFGNLLAKGVKEEINRAGFIGILTGGLKAAAAGMAAAVLFSFGVALAFEPKAK